MSKLNIFIDGSWLFKACAPERALAQRTESPDRLFHINFMRLQEALLAHASTHVHGCDEAGDAYLCTSIFHLPEDIDEWPEERDSVSKEDIETLKRSTVARERFAQEAVNAGFKDVAILRPNFKGWMLERLKAKTFQEKQVDATVVALLVKYAITQPDDVHVIITGDSDVLPAIKVAYPEYSRNVFVASIHPDQLRAESRQTSFALHDFEYLIPALYLEDRAAEIMKGDHVYTCAHCAKAFARQKAIPARSRPCCSPCHQQRT